MLGTSEQILLAEAVLDIYRFIESLLAPHPSLFCPPSAGFIAIAATAADTVNFSEDSRYPSTLSPRPESSLVGKKIKTEGKGERKELLTNSVGDCSGGD